MGTEIHIRRATPADADDIARILHDAFGGIAARHNFPPDFASPERIPQFISAFLHHPGIFGVVAESEGRVVGSNFLDCRDAIAGVGPISVDPAAQGRGAGRMLMRTVIEHGRSAPGTRGIRLVQDAFNTVSMSLYASLGFEAKEPLALMQGKPRGLPEPGQGADVQPMREEDLSECAALCAKVHRFDRANELRDAIRFSHPLVLRRDGRVAAYLAAPTFWISNHGVAESERDLQDLLRGAGGGAGAGAGASEPLSLLVPIRRASFFRWCLAEGLRVVKPMTLMAMGEYQEPNGPFFPSVSY